MKDSWKKDITLFLTSQTISLLGSSLVQYAIFWYITLNTKSGVMMTIYIICGFLPTFFMSPFAGVWADRFNRKVLIMLSDSFIALVTLVMIILFAMGNDSIILLFVMSSLRAVGTGVQSPAVSAILPQIVPEDKLTRVNGINGSIQSAIMLVSPMISGLLYSFARIEVIFSIDVITAAMAVTVLLVFLKLPPRAQSIDHTSKGYMHDLKDGLAYIRSHSFVKAFFLFGGIFSFLVTPAAFMTPLQVTRNFGGEVWKLTAVEVTFSLGMLLGGAAVASWGGFKNRTYTMAAAGTLLGICSIAFGIIPIFWLYLAVMVVCGVFLPFFNTSATVLIQEKVEDGYLGRVFGVYGMISSAMMPLGMLVFGPAADAIPIEWILIGTGLLVLVLNGFLFVNRPMVEAGKPLVRLPEGADET